MTPSRLVELGDSMGKSRVKSSTRKVAVQLAVCFSAAILLLVLQLAWANRLDWAALDRLSFSGGHDVWEVASFGGIREPERQSQGRIQDYAQDQTRQPGFRDVEGLRSECVSAADIDIRMDLCQLTRIPQCVTTD